MKKILDIIVINILALIALPFFLISVVFSMLSSAFRKCSLFLALALAGIIVYSLIPLVPTSFMGWLDLLVTLVAFIVVFALVVIVCLLIITFASFIVTVIYGICSIVLEAIKQFTYLIYLFLFGICDGKYQELSLNGKAVPNAIVCPFFTLLKGCSRLVMIIIPFAFPASIAAGILLVVYTLLDLHTTFQSTLGLSLTQFLGKCETPALILSVVVYLYFIGLMVVLIIQFGLEMRRWALEINADTYEISNKLEDLCDNEISLDFDETAKEDREKCEEKLAILQKHMEAFDTLSDQVESMLKRHDDPILRTHWTNYMQNLSTLVNTCTEDAIPVAEFKILIPQIQALDKQQKNLLKLVEKLEEQLKDPSGSSTFFVGCDTLEKLDKRYASLCKAYRPDDTSKDTTAFAKMNEEYEALKANFMQFPAGSGQKTEDKATKSTEDFSKKTDEKSVKEAAKEPDKTSTKEPEPAKEPDTDSDADSEIEDIM